MAKAVASEPSPRAAALRSRWLPRGPLDLLLQLGLIALAYTAWRYARGAVHGDTVAELGPALANARELVDWERSLGLLFEPSLQSWAIDAGWPAEIARWGYANLHFKLSCLGLLTLYFWRPGSYPFVRNVVIAAMAISLLGYAFFPTAPPRFVPELGLDGSAAVAGNEPLRLSGTDALYNPFAAVPSMHIGLALILAGSLALLARRVWVRAALLAYPLLMTYIVIASGNHFWLDAVFGAICAGLAVAVAVGLARLHPVWSFRAASPRRSRSGIEPAGEPEAATA
jgi:hypothetical protein